MAFIDVDAWSAWLRSLDAAWLFLVILALVVVVVGLWSRSLKADRTSDSKEEQSGS